MSPMRWMFCHQMMMDVERREIRRYARLLGTDLSLFRDKPDDDTGYGPVKAIPLAGLLAPEVYKAIANKEIEFEDHEIPEDQYEEQIKALEAEGGLSDIEIISTKVDKAVAGIKHAKLHPDDVPVWEPWSGPPPGAAPAPVAPKPTPGPSPADGKRKVKITRDRAS